MHPIPFTIYIIGFTACSIIFLYDYFTQFEEVEIAGIIISRDENKVDLELFNSINDASHVAQGDIIMHDAYIVRIKNDDNTVFDVKIESPDMTKDIERIVDCDEEQVYVKILCHQYPWTKEKLGLQLIEWRIV